MGWSLLPNSLWPFQIYCALPNLGITRPWICRLNFAHLFFQAWGSLTSLKSRTRDPQLKVSLPEDLCSGFLRPEKLHRPQPGLNPRTFDLKASTLPRDYRGAFTSSNFNVLYRENLHLLGCIKDNTLTTRRYAMRTSKHWPSLRFIKLSYTLLNHDDFMRLRFMS